MAGETAPPTSAMVVMSPCAGPRPCGGNQRASIRAVFGNAPASPAPNRNRISTSDQSPVAAPVRAVNTDHQTMIRHHAARAVAIAPGAGRHFKEAIGERERGEDVAHLGVVDAKVGL